jgi:PAS domain S-box-containing protein
MNNAMAASKKAGFFSKLPLPAIFTGLMLVIAAVFAAWAVTSARTERVSAINLERHSFKVLLQSEKVSSALQNAETGSRGYLLTRDTQFVQTFNEGANEAPRELFALKVLTRDNPAQQDNIDQLERTVDVRLDMLRQGVELAAIGNQAKAVELVKPGEGFGSLNSALSLLDEINRVETVLLNKRGQQAATVLRRWDLTIGALLVLMTAMIAYGIYTLISATRSQLQAEALQNERDLAKQLLEADAVAVRAAAVVTAVGAATPDLIYAKDRQGRIAYANPGTLAVVGLPLEDLLGRLTVEYSSDRQQAEAIDANDMAVMDSGETKIVDEVFNMPDGTPRMFRSTKTPLKDDDGNIIGLAGVGADVTAERRAMVELKASEERFRSLSETAPAFIFITDCKGAITYTNNAFQEYTGRSGDELNGMGWVQSVHTDDRDIPHKAWADAIERQIPYSAEYRFHHHRNGCRWHLCRATPVRDEAGEIRQWIGTCSDIQDAIDARQAAEQLNQNLEAMVAERTTELNSALQTLRMEVAEREKAEAQIRQMQKIESIGQLTGGIAHDFNNMLAVILGSLEIVKRRLQTDPDKALTGIEHAEEGARRAAQLTARLLAFSRQQPLAPVPVNANILVGSMSEMLRQTIGEQIEIETVLAGGLWKTHIDAPQLENAIVNLCVNARDAMPDGGKLTIETHNCHLDENYAASNPEVSAGQYVLVSVTDCGHGMPAEVIERAFDPFYTTKEVGKGTGLGLSQVFGFVKQSGGHIKIYSEISQGTTVKLYLPRYFGKDELAVSSLAAPHDELPTAIDGETILIVEDDSHVRKVSVQLIRDLGYEVIEVTNGAEALAILANGGRVDLMFTDIVMPGMNGRAVADQAVQLRENLKILYTTGYTRNAVVHNGVLDFGTEFISKPYTTAALATKLRAVLDKV